MNPKVWRDNWINKILEAGEDSDALGNIVGKIYDDGFADGQAAEMVKDYVPDPVPYEDRD